MKMEKTKEDDLSKKNGLNDERVSRYGFFLFEFFRKVF
jgi:hypothetical protein